MPKKKQLFTEVIYTSNSYTSPLHKFYFDRKMKRRILIAALGSVAFLTACGTSQPLIATGNSNPTGSSKHAPTLKEIKKAIYLAGSSRGWVMKEVNSKTIQATYVKGQHTGVVDIEYDRETYTITPNKKSTLMRPDGTVDRHLNNWIRNLDLSIKKELVRLTINNEAK